MTRSHVRIFRNEGTLCTRLDPKLIFWYISYNLGAFGTVWLHDETRCKTGRTSAKSSCHEVASEFFATNAPDRLHWTLNWCFCAFQTIWVHSGQFGSLTKLGPKWAELVKKFVPQSRVGIFRNEGTRSTPLDPKLMFFLRFILFDTKSR